MLGINSFLLCWVLVLSWAVETCSLCLRPLQRTLLDRTAYSEERAHCSVALSTRVPLGPPAAEQGGDCDHLRGK